MVAAVTVLAVARVISGAEALVLVGTVSGLSVGATGVSTAPAPAPVAAPVAAPAPSTSLIEAS